ncbi:hypothetical protein Tco_1125137 [Tanacetum coccineum]|uniref:Retrovirus-related Pol polyprotein from transposon TNT 1-94 n=1 Tax=Tanacetum coccineum TaxID=301880 RepID=A0ABQ5J858_9ASTR
MAAGVWKKLEKLYMTKSSTNKLLLKQRLFSLQMKEGPTLKDHLDALNSILMDLKNVEVMIDDENAALILLVSLPPSFENFVNSFVVEKDTITLEDVRSKEGHWKFNYPKVKEKGHVAVVAKDDSGLERDVVLLVVDYKEFDSGHVFMGNDSPCKVVSEEKLDPGGEKDIFIGYGDGVEDAPKQVEHVVPGDADHDDTSPNDHTNSPHLEHEQDRSIALDRPCRNAKAPSRFGFEDYVAYALQVAKEVESLEPATYQEAITSEESDM